MQDGSPLPSKQSAPFRIICRPCNYLLLLVLRLFGVTCRSATLLRTDGAPRQRAVTRRAHLATHNILKPAKVICEPAPAPQHLVRFPFYFRGAMVTTAKQQHIYNRRCLNSLYPCCSLCAGLLPSEQSAGLKRIAQSSAIVVAVSCSSCSQSGSQ